MTVFGALEVAQRQYDIACEVRDFLKAHPRAAVVNLGCGLEDTFLKSVYGLCRGCNIDMPDVIGIRNALLPPGEREKNLAFDLNDDEWMNQIDPGDGAIFCVMGIFCYFRAEDVFH